MEHWKHDNDTNCLTNLDMILILCLKLQEDIQEMERQLFDTQTLRLIIKKTKTKLDVNDKMISTQSPFIVEEISTISHSNDQQMAWYYSDTQPVSPGVLELNGTIYLGFGVMMRSGTRG